MRFRRRSFYEEKGDLRSVGLGRWSGIWVAQKKVGVFGKVRGEEVVRKEERGFIISRDKDEY